MYLVVNSSSILEESSFGEEGKTILGEWNTVRQQTFKKRVETCKSRNPKPNMPNLIWGPLIFPGFAWKCSTVLQPLQDHHDFSRNQFKGRRKNTGSPMSHSHLRILPWFTIWFTIWFTMISHDFLIFPGLKTMVLPPDHPPVLRRPQAPPWTSTSAPRTHQLSEDDFLGPRDHGMVVVSGLNRLGPQSVEKWLWVNTYKYHF